MITHIGLLTWVDGIEESDIQAFERELAELPKLIPQIQSLKFSRDAGFTDESADFIVIVKFAKKADFDAYIAHPDHVALIDNLGRKTIGAYSGIQF